MSNVSKGYELVLETKLEGAVPVRKFKSLQSGITVYVAEVEGPLVHGMFTLATEAHDDDGLPHTLEHLIFLGSEEYPFKGVLDLVANRCMASGTNAWTAVDRTCYTISTAGSEGFLRFLPIYLDHILYPTLTESGFVTEVHHVNGKGEDGGVVYCEMQAVENTGPNLVSDRFMKTMYPENCGYRSETGGALKNLQESTTHLKVKDYHRTFYRPENLCLIVVGIVTAEDIFEAIKPIESKILSKKREEYIRPWQTPVPPLSNSVETQVEFPSDDEESGIVKIGWRAPPRDDVEAMVALDVLLTYLQDTSISPLQKEFIEVDDPLCGQIDIEDAMYMNEYFSLGFENVPIHHLSGVTVKLFELLSKFCTGEMKFDESRMNDVIQRRIWSIYSRLESEPKDIISDYLIADFVYGTGNSELEKLVNRVEMLKKLMANVSNVEWWQNLLKKYLITNHHVAVVGIPSRKAKETIAENEKLRVAKQRERLGVDGLKKLTEVIEKAVQTNEIPPPASMISAFGIPDIAKINFHPILRSSNHSSLVPDGNQLFHLSDIPYRIELDDVHSKFATMYGIMDTSCIPRNLKMFLPLFMELMLESPILRNGELIQQEQVMAELSRDTVSFKTSLGIPSIYSDRFECGSYAQMAFLCLQVDIEHYVQGVTWLHDLLFYTKMTPERVKIVAKKMLSDVAQLKRQGYFMSKVLAVEQCFNRESNHRVNGVGRQHGFLTLLLTKLATDPEPIINALEELKSILTSVDNITVHLAVDVASLSSTYDGRRDLIWKEKYPADQPREQNWIWSQKCTADQGLLRKDLHVQHCNELFVSPVDSDSCVLNAVLGLGSVESSFLQLSSRCITDCRQPDLPALLVLLEYLCQLEGPLWKNLRGQGLVYSYSVRVNSNRGLITAMLYRSTDVVSAFKEFVKIMENHLNGTESWDNSLLESARSSLLFTLIREVDCVMNLTIKSIKLHFDSLESDYQKKLLKSVMAVTVEQMQAAGSKYAPRLFEPSQSFLSISCNSSKVEVIQEGFNEHSRNVKSVSFEGGILDCLDDIDKSYLC